MGFNSAFKGLNRISGVILHAVKLYLIMDKYTRNLQYITIEYVHSDNIRN